MKILPKNPEISPTEGFSKEKDIFGYENFGTKLVSLFDVSEDIFVSVIDGNWGVGKTTFVKMLGGEFRKSGFPTIYFDAFENDYLDDPFMAISSEIIELAQEKKLAAKPAYKKFVQSAGRTALQVSKTAVKIGAKAVTLGVLDNEKFDALDNIAGDVGTLAADTMEKSVESLLQSRKEQKETIQKFDKSLSDLVGLISPQSEKPLIFIIDELDRCRPDFALGLLERIKHFYRIENVYFILVANLEQLSHSVCARYGNGINGQNYLQKFFDLKFELTPNFKGARQEIYWNSMCKQAEVYPNEKSSLIIKSWCSYRDISLRELQKIFVVKQLVSVTWEREWYVEIVSILCIANVLFPSLFSKILKENASFQDIEVSFKMNDWFKLKGSDSRDELINDVIISWQFLLDKTMSVPSGGKRLDVYSHYGGFYDKLKGSFQLVS